MVLASATLGDSWKLNLLFNVLNTFEAYLAALLLRPRSALLPHFTDARYLLRFVGFAACTSPVVFATIFATAGAIVHQPRPELLFMQWTASDMLGMAVIAPTCVAIYRCRFRRPLDWGALGVQLLLIGMALAAFTHSMAPLLFFLLPLLMLILLRYGIGWSALSLLLIASIGGSMTIRGEGPFAVLGNYDIVWPSVLFQLFLVAGLCMLYITSAVTENLRNAKTALNESVAFHELIAANLNEVIIVEDFSGKCTYISPASRKFMGPEISERNCRRSHEPYFADEQTAVQLAFEKVRSGEECEPLQYRLLRPDGKLVWVEAGMKLMRDPATGVHLGVLKILRDIDERKKQEEQLHEAYRALETLAISDPLTHLANRRHFDKFLCAEWRRSIRLQEPISILVLDVDYFKSFNDAYGHLCGDSCLRQIAEAAQDVVMRSSDLVARIGGEEFAVVLQNTDSTGAAEVAERIRESVIKRHIRHEGNPLGHLTISIGCASCIPQQGQQVRDLIDRADQALYRAKRSGRNRIDTSATCEHRESTSIAS